MFTKIIFRSFLLLMVTLLYCCVPDDSVSPSIEKDISTTQDRLATIADNNAISSQVISQKYQPTGLALDQTIASVIPIPNLSVAILPNHCLMGGATLWAVNPKKPGNPAYSGPTFTVKWYKDGELIATGVNLTDCVCGPNISVRVKDTISGAEGEAMYLSKPCKTNNE